jgi:hypothetical protein
MYVGIRKENEYHFFQTKISDRTYQDCFLVKISLSRLHQRKDLHPVCLDLSQVEAEDRSTIFHTSTLSIKT